MSTLEDGSERGVLLTNTDNSGSERELPRRCIHELGGRSRALIRETRPHRVARSLRVRRVKAVLDDAFSDLWKYESATLPRRRRERFLSATRSLTSIHETDETRVQSVSPETVNDELKDIA